MRGHLRTRASSSNRRLVRRHQDGDIDPWVRQRGSCSGLGASLAFLALGVYLFYKDIQPAYGVGICVFGGPVFLISLLFCVDSLGQFLSHHRLIKFGNVATGVIIQTESKMYDGFGSYSDVRFKFVTHEGEEIEGRWEHAEPPFSDSKPGDTFTVLYDPYNPTNHIAYENALFKVAEVDGYEAANQLLRPSEKPVDSRTLLRLVQNGSSDPTTLLRPAEADSGAADAGPTERS